MMLLERFLSSRSIGYQVFIASTAGIFVGFFLLQVGSIFDYIAIPLFMISVLIFIIFCIEFNGDYFKSIVFILYYFAFVYVVIPVIQVSQDMFVHPHIGDTSQIATKALLYCFMALLFLYIGYKNKLGTYVARKIPNLSNSWSTKRFFFAIIFFFLTALGAYYLLLYLNGGFYNFMAHIGNRSRLIQGKGPIREAINLVYIALLGSYILMIEKKNKCRVCFFLILLVLSLSIMITLGGGGSVILIALSLLFMHNYLVKRLKLKTLFLTFLMILFFLYVHKTIRQSVYMYTSLQSITNLFYTAPKQGNDVLRKIILSFDSFECFMEILERVPVNVNFSFGRTYLDGLLGLIPRAIYANKPFGTAAYVNYIINGVKFYNTSDLSAPQSASAISMIHELYLNFSFVGIIIGFFLDGIVLRFFYEYLTLNRDNKMVVLLWTLLFPLIVSLGSDSFQFVIRFFSTIVPFVVFYLFVRRKRQIKPIFIGRGSRCP